MCTTLINAYVLLVHFNNFAKTLVVVTRRQGALTPGRRVRGRQIDVQLTVYQADIMNFINRQRVMHEMWRTREGDDDGNE